MLHLAVNIFHREPGLEFLARWAHVLVGILRQPGQKRWREQLVACILSIRTHVDM